MAFPEEPKGAQTPEGHPAPEASASGESLHSSHPEPAHAVQPSAPEQPEPEAVGGVVLTDPYDSYESTDHSPNGHTVPASAGQAGNAVTLTPPERPSGKQGGSAPPKPPKPPETPDEPDEEDGMARMSFIEHLEELRSRLIWSIAGVAIAFVLCLLFSDQLWNIVFEPAGAALKSLGVNPPTLKLISPTDTFQIMWMKVPILFSIFLSSPWVLWQVWKFISPGLYKHEKRYAVPFVVSSAGLFILGGLFAYFIAFRYGLEFLLGLGIG